MMTLTLLPHLEIDPRYSLAQQLERWQPPVRAVDPGATLPPVAHATITMRATRRGTPRVVVAANDEPSVARTRRTPGHLSQSLRSLVELGRERAGAHCVM